MRRVARHLFTLLSALSLLLCVATCGLWVRSFWRVTGLSNELYRNGQVRGESGIWSMGGRLVFDTARHLDVSRWPGPLGWTISDEPRNSSPQFVDARGAVRWEHLGFKAAQSISQSGDGTRFEMAAIAVPYWAVAAVTSLLPLLAIRRTIIIRCRQSAGLCLTCGYDLRASPERCPECGTPSAAGTSASSVESRD